MPTSDRSLIHKAKDNFDWDSYIHDHYEVMYSGDQLRVCCPWCQEHKFKFYVYPDGGFHCFKCGKHKSATLDVIHFIAITEGIGYVQALLNLTAEYSPKAMSDEEMTKWLESKKLDEALEAAIQIKPVRLPTSARSLFFTDNDPVWLYAKNRGLTKKMLLAAGVKGLYNDASYGQRLLFPIYAGDAVLYSWQARDITGLSKAKYVSAPKSNLGKALWPNVSNTGTAVLVEGIIDAMSLRRATSHSAYATFGKHIAKAQCAALAKFGTKKVILWYDKSDAKKEMIKAVKLLKDYVDAVAVVSFENWDSSLDVGDLLLVNSDTAATAINEQLDNAIDCGSLDYSRWCLSGSDND